MQAYQTAYGGNMNDQLLRQLGIDQQILQQMIDEQAALAEAERQGIRVSDEELAQQIFSIPGLQENGRFIGEERYEQLLRSQRPPMTKGDFEENLRRSMMIDKLRAALTDWMAVADAELEREYRQRNEKVKLQVVALTADRFRDQVTVTDADVAAYFDSAQGRLPHRRAAQGQDAAPRSRAGAREGDRRRRPTSQRYYNDNIQQYQTPEQVRASHILLNTAGKDEAAVRKQAEDILKQAQGRRRLRGARDASSPRTRARRSRAATSITSAAAGWCRSSRRRRSRCSPDRSAISSRRSSASTSSRSWTSGRRRRAARRGAARRSRTARVAARRPADRARSQDELADRINNPADLDTVARENGLTVVESGSSSAATRPGPRRGAAGPAAAFTLEDNAVSDALNTPRGPVFVTVSGKSEPYVPKLDEVKDRVREDLIRSRATELSRQRAAADRRGAESGERQLRRRRQGAGLRGEGHRARRARVGAAGRRRQPGSRQGRRSPCPQAASAIRSPRATARSSSAWSSATTSRPDEFRPAKETFRAELLNERRSRFFTAYMTKAKEQMEIEVNNDVVRRVVGA